MGYSAGLRGSTPESYQTYQVSCAEHGLLSNAQALYLEGWQNGNQAYCQPVNGFTTGSNGGRYEGVCQGERETAFLNAYYQGHNSFIVRIKFDELKQQIAELEKRVVKMQRRQTEQSHKQRHYNKDIADLKKEIEALKKK